MYQRKCPKLQIRKFVVINPLSNVYLPLFRLSMQVASAFLKETMQGNCELMECIPKNV